MNFSIASLAGRLLRNVPSQASRFQLANSVRFMSTLHNRFLETSVKVQVVIGEASTDEKLEIYSLYKQVVTGKCDIPKPKASDLEGSAKYKAWQALGDMGQDEAKEKYVAVVNSILKRAGKEEVL